MSSTFVVSRGALPLTCGERYRRTEGAQTIAIRDTPIPMAMRGLRPGLGSPFANFPSKRLFSCLRIERLFARLPVYGRFGHDGSCRRVSRDPGPVYFMWTVLRPGGWRIPPLSQKTLPRPRGHRIPSLTRGVWRRCRSRGQRRGDGPFSLKSLPKPPAIFGLPNRYLPAYRSCYRYGKVPVQNATVGVCMRFSSCRRRRGARAHRARGLSKPAHRIFTLESIVMGRIEANNRRWTSGL